MFRAFVIAMLRGLACAALIFIAWLAGFVWFVQQVPREATDDTQHTDAIVVLTGGKGRIAYGLKLLSEGRASRLFISGVEDGLTLSDLAIHNYGSAVVMLGYDARNTIGNAMETAQFMRKEHLKSLRLVTASYHMPRALYEMHFQMRGVLIVPDPVFPADFDADRWWTGNASSLILLSEYHKYIAARLRHWLLRISGETP